ncbi:hypothetical protein HY439_00775 [Candidatus Microgenomates bacterium]|nr:hypothetical protein [Candidatus Microgenomates bacterium]
MKKIEKYFSKHVYMNSISHVFVGLGLGALLANGYFNPHPVRYGMVFLAIGIFGHLYAYFEK